MKLHWCCGDIYLEDYVNIDIVGRLASGYALEENPNKTTLDKYYKKQWDENFDKRMRGPFIVDRCMNILRPWPYADESIGKIVMISCWEHFSKEDIFYIKSEIERVLVHNGRLIVDFPDIRKNVGLYYNADPEFMMELIYCNGKDERSQHKWGYTAKSFAAMWSDAFVVEEKTIVKHDYPMIGMEVVKL